MYRPDFQKLLPPKLLNELIVRLRRKDEELKKEEKHVEDQEKSNLQNQMYADTSETADSIMDDTEQEYTRARLDLIHRGLLQVRKALAKVKIGTYGICDNCHLPIDVARLKAYPQATTCLECSKRKQSAE